MRPPTSTATLLALAALPLLVPAQFLSNTDYGSLPSCATNCGVLSSAQSGCGAGDWACFCTGVWGSIESAPQQICSASCQSPAQVYQWYDANCGSDNGATAHPNSGSGGGNGNSNSNSGNGGGNGNNGGNGNGGNGNGDGNGNGNGGANSDGSGRNGAGATSGSSDSSGTTSGGSPDEDKSWWEKSWKYIVMLIVLIIALAALTFLGVFLKRRHARRRDQITSGFNAGITSQPGPGPNPPMGAAPGAHGTTSSLFVDGDGTERSGRDSPARTRSAFMPYGYGYTRSESRLAGPQSADDGHAAPRGGTPVGELEKSAVEEAPGERAETPSKRSKLRKVLVREKSGGSSL